MRYRLFLAFLVLIAVPVASANVGSPSEIQINSDEGIFQASNEPVLGFRWDADRFSNGEIVLEKDTINSGISEGEVREDFRARIEGTDQKNIYGLTREGQMRDIELREDSIDHGNAFDWPSVENRKAEYDKWAQNNCHDFNGDGEPEYFAYENSYGIFGDGLRADLYCADTSSNRIATLSSIDTDEEIVSTSFTVDGETKTVSTQGSGTATFGGHTKINLRGGLESGFDLPQGREEYVAYSNNGQAFQGFRLVDDQALDNYESYSSRVENELVKNWAETEQKQNIYYYSRQELENRIDNKLNGFVEKKDNSEFYQYASNSDESIFRGTSIEDGEIVIESDRRSVYPSFQVYTKGSNLRYFIPDADPSIENVGQPGEIEEGNTGFISVTVGNTGSGTGSFEVGVSQCSDPFTFSQNYEGVELGAGESVKTQLRVSLGTSTLSEPELEGNCEVEVRNLRNPGETASSSVSVTGVQAKECSEGDKSYQINENGRYEVLQCTNGVEKEVVETCAGDQDGDGLVDEIVDTETYECVERSPGNDPVTGGDGSGGSTGGSGSKESCMITVLSVPDSVGSDVEFSNPLCGDVLDQVKNIFALALGIIGGFLGYRTVSFVDGERQIRGRFKATKSRRVSRPKNARIPVQVIGALLGFVIGLGVGFLVPLIIQAGVLALLGAIKFVVPGL